MQFLVLKANFFLKCSFIKNSENIRILLGNCILNFQDKALIFLIKIEIFNFLCEYFIEISRIIKTILFFYFGNPRFSGKIRYAYTDMNSSIFRIFDKTALQKEIFLYMLNDYPQLNYLMGEVQKEIKKLEINKETTERSILIFREEGYFENCLMLILISKYYLNSDFLTLVRFEDFGTRRDRRQFLNIFIKCTIWHEMIYVDEETFAVVRELKKSTLANKRQQYKTNSCWRKSC